MLVSSVVSLCMEPFGVVWYIMWPNSLRGRSKGSSCLATVRFDSNSVVFISKGD